MLAFNLIVYIGNCKMEKYNKVIKLNNFEPKENALSEKELRIQLAAAYRIFNYLKSIRNEIWWINQGLICILDGLGPVS